MESGQNHLLAPKGKVKPTVELVMLVIKRVIGVAVLDTLQPKFSSERSDGCRRPNFLTPMTIEKHIRSNFTQYSRIERTESFSDALAQLHTYLGDKYHKPILKTRVKRRVCGSARTDPRSQFIGLILRQTALGYSRYSTYICSPRAHRPSSTSA